MPGTFVLRCSQAPFLQFVLCRPMAVLGRSRKCEFVVHHRAISRRHAEITIGESELLVTDLDSRNGTFVDDVRVSTSKVAPGQLIRFGSLGFSLAILHEELSSEDVTDKTEPQARARHSPRIATREMLSEAQRKVFELLITGIPEKTIARGLHLSQHTVHNHVGAILRVFAVNSRVELLAGLLKKNHDDPHER